MPVDNASERADALGLVLDDRLQEFEVGRPEIATERGGLLDCERRLSRRDVLAGVERGESLLSSLRSEYEAAVNMNAPVAHSESFLRQFLERDDTDIERRET
jgi:hypothetical protein